MFPHTNPQNGGLDANLEAKLTDTRNQEQGEKEALVVKVKESPEGKKLQNLLGKQNTSLFSRILTEYSNISKQKQGVDSNSLEQAIKKVIRDPITTKQLGYAFDSDSVDKVINTLITGMQNTTPTDMGSSVKTSNKIGEKGEDSFSEEALLQRLVVQGHIKKEDSTEFKKTQKDASPDEQRLALKTFIQDKITDKKITKNLEDTLFPPKDIKIINEKNFQSSPFFQDAGEPKPPFNDFNTLIAENYTKIPNQQGETDKQADFQMALERSIQKIKTKNSKELNETLSAEYENFKNAKTNSQRYMILNKIFVQSQTEKAKQMVPTKRTETQNGPNARLAQWFQEAQLRQIESLHNITNQNNARAEEEMAERARENQAGGSVAALAGSQKLDVVSNSPFSRVPISSPS